MWKLIVSLALAVGLVVTWPGHTMAQAPGGGGIEVEPTDTGYDFEPLDLESPDAEPLPEIDLVSVPFINWVGSIAMTVFQLFDQYGVLPIFLVLLLSMFVLFWLFGMVMGRSGQVNLKDGPSGRSKNPFR
ncbi:MAG: hypothetical protein HC875_29235 [Anaerolineales bacterium]|nr:hypothetical protein [Anaerolineales bacterium]